MKEWGAELPRDKQLVLAQIRHSGRLQARVLEVEQEKKDYKYILIFGEIYFKSWTNLLS